MAYLIQPVIWIALSLLLNVNKTKRNLFVIIIFSLSFVLTYKRFLIIITSIHRDYLPSIWPNDLFDESLSLLILTFKLTLYKV
jgi:hypothetical protein